MYRWIDHPAEIELSIEAQSEPAVFAEALAAFTELVGDEGTGESVRHEIELEAGVVDDLLADWLDELVYLADVEGFVPERLMTLDIDGLAPSTLDADGVRLRAKVCGHRGEPRPIVKAVTRHRLDVERDEGGWRARVVLDV